MEIDFDRIVLYQRLVALSGRSPLAAYYFNLVNGRIMDYRLQDLLGRSNQSSPSKRGWKTCVGILSLLPYLLRRPSGRSRKILREGATTESTISIQSA